VVAPSRGIRRWPPRPRRARRRHALGEELLRQADAQAGERACSRSRGVVLGRALQAGGVARVEAGHAPQQQGAVLGAPRHRPALVERGGEGDHAVARHHAVGRLDAGDAAQGGRLADRAAGVGAGGAGARRAATAAAEPPEEPPGTAAGVPGVLHRAEDGEVSLDEPMANSSMLVLPSVTVPAALSARPRGVVGADEVGQHLRAAGGEHALGAENVLVRQRDAGERAASPRPGGRRRRAPWPGAFLGRR
jgi:hypothetical protein